ncbi:MAG: hypothetical protein EHM45_23250 [Desulfobacteraceae bacterium]|nr:MAG: hypothetical protein EHM45_23250 [Desulfobacteraceae bacterium]
MKKYHLFLFGFLSLILLSITPYGCSSGHQTYYQPPYTERFYTPKQIPITPGMILKPEFNICKDIMIINAHADAGNASLPACIQNNESLGAYTHLWSGNLKMWTDTACGVTKTELKNRGVKISQNIGKKLALSIDHACLSWGFRTIGCTLDLKVETGDGHVSRFQVANEAINLYDSCDGAVTKAVAALFNDASIRTYLTCPLPERLPKKKPVTPAAEKPALPEGPADTDEDGVPDYRDECPGTPKGAVADVRGCWVIGSALFDFDRSEIKSRYYQILDEVLYILRKNPALKIEIQGHTCNIGSAIYNQRLSESRAHSVMNYFISKGIGKERLIAIGYGYSKPAASNFDENGRILNRRVEFVTTY